MIQDKDLYWLAGLLEGEGTFFPQTEKYPLGFSIETTDEDVMARVCNLIQSKYNKPSKRKLHHKQSFKTGRRGKPALDIMIELLPLMGERRSKRIMEAINSFKPKRIKSSSIS